MQNCAIIWLAWYERVAASRAVWLGWIVISRRSLMLGIGDNCIIEHVPLIKSRWLTSYAYQISHTHWPRERKIRDILLWQPTLHQNSNCVLNQPGFTLRFVYFVWTLLRYPAHKLKREIVPFLITETLWFMLNWRAKRHHCCVCIIGRRFATTSKSISKILSSSSRR